jgi:hypothetical protein
MMPHLRASRAQHVEPIDRDPSPARRW